MGKDKYAPEAEAILRGTGMTVRAESSRRKGRKEDAGFTSGERDDEPDLVCVTGQHGIFIEIKTFKASFKMSSLREGQRQWLRDALQNGSNCWLWFWGGDHPANYNRDKVGKDGSLYRPRTPWLIPFDVYEHAEKRFEGIQRSIPYGMKRKMNPKIRAGNWTFNGMFKRYRIMIRKNGDWHFNAEHPFAQQFFPHMTFDKHYKPMFNVGDSIEIKGYEGDRFEIVGYRSYDWGTKCWLYSVEGITNEQKYSGIPENNVSKFWRKDE